MLYYVVSLYILVQELIYAVCRVTKKRDIDVADTLVLFQMREILPRK